jgi:DNA primase
MRYEALIRQHFDVSGQSGEEFIARCLWHEDGLKPNLYVNGRKGVYICYACGARGHLRSLAKELPPPSSLDLRRRLKPQPERRPQYLNESVLRQYAFDHPAWYERGLSPEAIRQFNLGYDPVDDVLIIPFRDYRNRLLGVIQRRLDDVKPKYRYPKGVPIGKHLFGAWALDGHKKVALVEGSIDAIACWDARIPALAMLGSRLTADQARLLSRLGIRHVVAMTDNDGPGKEAIPQIMEALSGKGIALSVGRYRPYWYVKDPAELKPDRRRKMYHSAALWDFS